MEYNSTTNQSIKGKLVEREIICSVNQTIQMLQKCNDSELEELFYTPDYEQSIENYLYDLDEDEREKVCDYVGLEYIEGAKLVREDFYTDDSEFCGYFNIEIEYNEPYEFWNVSSWLGSKLQEKGETVVDLLDFTVWARGTTGQAILLVRSYSSNLNTFFNDLPVSEFLLFYLTLLIVVIVFRIIKNLINLIKP